MTGMSRAWLWRQCRAGAIQHHRLGRHFSFSRDDLRDLMAQTAVSVQHDGLVPVGRGRQPSAA